MNQIQHQFGKSMTAVVNNLEAKISFNDCIESHFSQLNRMILTRFLASSMLYVSTDIEKVFFKYQTSKKGRGHAVVSPNR